MAAAARPLSIQPPGSATHHHQPHPSLSATETSRASSDVSSPHLPSLASPTTDFTLSSFPTPVLFQGNRKTLPPAIRRKPLSSSASPIATRYSSGDYVKTLPHPETRYERSFSVDSPTVYEFPVENHMSRQGSWDSTTKHSEIVVANNKDNSPDNQHHTADPVYWTADPAVIPGEQQQDHPTPAAPQTAVVAVSPQAEQVTPYDNQLVDEDSDNILDGYNSDSSDNLNHSPAISNMSLHISRKPAPQHLTLQPLQPSLIRTDSNELKTPNTDKPLPKSPSSSRLGSFFNWGTPSPNPDQIDRGFSPLPSPFKSSKVNGESDVSPEKPNFGSPNSREYCESYLATPAGSPDPNQLDEMEDELKAISAELAASIRREMDLEDLVDRLQAEKENPTAAANKRTSDYFSDSGYSSAKFSEYDQSREEIEKIQRRSEQEKAQLRLELTNKLQDERLRRQQMDEQIRDLSAKASRIDLATMDGQNGGRVKELEETCGTLRRKLSDERQVKDNFEDLLGALRSELLDASNERDNLRDEVVPQLRARVEGLESQAAELEKMNYESSKMQQELQNLRNENSSLKHGQIGSITEEGDVSRGTLSRSNSIGGASFRLQRPPSGLSRSKTIKTSESRDQLSERLKDVEEQRDALHRALKSLLERQEHQNRENQKRIKFLELERDRILSSSPQKASFQMDVTNLRSEITVLRRRAEDALDQKWQVERGLAGLKLDLDRAELEISSLKKLLDEKDILIANGRLSSGSDVSTPPATSDSLMAAYEDLQAAYADSLERIRNLENGSASGEKTQLAMEKLELALSSVVSQRDLAKGETASYIEQLESLKASEQAYLQSEKALADELQESARRIEELAIQVQQQLSTNQELRKRITDTVQRGEADRKNNVGQITSLQARLRSLEEKLEVAQASSEDRVARHEEEMSKLKESHSVQLTRLRDGLRSPRTFPGNTPLSPLFTATGAKSPRITSTRSGPAMNVSEETQVDNLRARVAELENALLDADAEMQQVVGRMNTAQIEVLQLQEEREAAVNQTRRLEKELQAEKVKAFEGRFRTLQS
ncbi:hypothetical protein F5Y16DRAFT_369441 [Xylariaceae sp. FL0255]|nr:hypothetical protein F5Y16DRAFT_369441 [Xylariaceae sp. FL0255]